MCHKRSCLTLVAAKSIHSGEKKVGGINAFVFFTKATQGIAQAIHLDDGDDLDVYQPASYPCHRNYLVTRSSMIILLGVLLNLGLIVCEFDIKRLGSLDEKIKDN